MSLQPALTNYETWWNRRIPPEGWYLIRSFEQIIQHFFRRVINNGVLAAAM